MNWSIFNPMTFMLPLFPFILFILTFFQNENMSLSRERKGTLCVHLLFFILIFLVIHFHFFYHLFPIPSARGHTNSLSIGGRKKFHNSIWATSSKCQISLLICFMVNHMHPFSKWVLKQDNSFIMVFHHFTLNMTSVCSYSLWLALHLV